MVVELWGFELQMLFKVWRFLLYFWLCILSDTNNIRGASMIQTSSVPTLVVLGHHTLGGGQKIDVFFSVRLLVVHTSE